MRQDRRQFIEEMVAQLVPIDDIMFRKMAEDKAFCEELLRTVMEDPQLTVLEAKPQFDVTNLQGRSVILDAYCELGDGRRVDVEVQQADNLDHQRRVRYNTALLTANISDKGIRFEDIPDVCAVYISRFDMFGYGLPVYHIDRHIRETEKTVFNGQSEIYVNASARDGSAIARLMRVYTQVDAFDADFPVTSRIKQRLKGAEEGKKTMCEIAEKLMYYGREEGREEGRSDTVVSLVKSGLLTAAQGAAQLGMSLEKFEALRAEFEK